MVFLALREIHPKALPDCECMRGNCSQMSHRERIAYLHKRVTRRRVLVVNAVEVREPIHAHALVVVQHDVRVVNLSRCVVPPPDCCGRCVCVSVCVYIDQFRCVLPVFRRTWKRRTQVRTSLHPFLACAVRREQLPQSNDPKGTGGGNQEGGLPWFHPRTPGCVGWPDH